MRTANGLIIHILRGAGSYQITLPKAVCGVLGIDHDTALKVTTDGRSITLTPVKKGAT